MYNTLYICVWQGAPDDGAYTCIRRCRTGLRGKEKKGKERERKEGERRGKGGERDFRSVPFPSLVPHLFEEVHECDVSGRGNGFPHFSRCGIVGKDS